MNGNVTTTEIAVTDARQQVPAPVLQAAATAERPNAWPLQNDRWVASWRFCQN